MCLGFWLWCLFKITGATVMQRVEKHKRIGNIKNNKLQVITEFLTRISDSSLMERLAK
jgi:hypothetical protein